MSSLQEDVNDIFPTIKGFKVLFFFLNPVFLREVSDSLETTHPRQDNKHL